VELGYIDADAGKTKVPEILYRTGEVAALRAAKAPSAQAKATQSFRKKKIVAITNHRISQSLFFYVLYFRTVGKRQGSGF